MVPAAPPLVVPRVLSKSSVKAMACPHHWIEMYVKQQPALRRVSSPLAEAGTAFHSYRAAYISYLVDHQLPADRKWALGWLRSQGFGDDAIQLIESDIYIFTINPENVMAVELFLSVDAEMRPLERIENFMEIGALSTHPEATDSGVIDLLQANGKHAQIVDVKSGWGTATVSDLEPPRYAGLVFAHFPQFETCEFIWEHPRIRATRRVSYDRSHLPAIHKAMQAAHRMAEAIVEMSNCGQRATANPQSGICPMCNLACPLKTEIAATTLLIPPIQTLTDAQRVAGLAYIAGIVAGDARKVLREWINVHGPVPLPNNWEASIHVSQRKDIPLTDALAVLGLELVPTGTRHLGGIDEPLLSPRYAVPLDKLCVRSSKLGSYAKARKREGLEQELVQIARLTPVSKVKIAREGENDIEEIEES